MNAIIDLELLDENEENPFEDVASFVERASLHGSIDHVTKEAMLKILLSTERRVQDLSETKTNEDMVAFTRAMEIAKSLSASTKDEDYVHILNTIQSGFASLNTVLNKKSEYSLPKLIQCFNVLSPKHYLEKMNMTKVSTNQLNMAWTVTLTNFNLIYAANDNADVLRQIRSHKSADVWEFTLDFDVPASESHKPLELIHLFIEVMNKIEGANFYLEEIKVGSIKSKIKAVFDDVKSKEEVKELLESTRKFAKAKLEKDFVEQEKIEAEKEKIEVEKDILENKLKESTSLEADYKRALEIRHLEEDLEKKKTDNFIQKLKALKEAKETYAEMLADGFISQCDFEMLIKGIPFMSLKDGILTIGESSDVIDDM